MSTSSNSGNSTSLYGEAGTPIPDSSGNVIVRGDLYVLSGNILTTATTGNIFPANATTINLGLAATAMNIGAATGTTTINNALTAGGTVTAPGADFGNITIGVATDNTITTTSGDLTITATGSNGVEIASGTTAPTSITRNTTAVSSGVRSLALAVQTSGTPTVGFGNSLEWQVETAPGNTENAGFVSVNITDLTPASEDFSMNFGLMQNGSAYTSKMSLTSAGNLAIDGDLTVGGVNINMEPSTNFLYSESNNRTNRPEFQSTSGNSSGLRVRAPNTTTSASSTFSVNNSSDSANTEFLSLQARGSALGDTFRFLTGEYIANVLSASNKSISFTDYTNTYATVNPAGPTIGTDLTTKTYVDNAVATTGVTSITGTANQVIASSATGAVTLSLPQSIATTSNVTFADVVVGDDLTVQGNNVNLAQATIIGYDDSNLRANRPSVQSTTGNSSGLRILAPNATTSAQSNMTIFGSNDIDNGEFLNIRASGSTTAPFSIRTGLYTAGVLGASGEEINFIDATTTYASVNPAGPTNSTDLTTKAYVDALPAGGVTSVTGGTHVSASPTTGAVVVTTDATDANTVSTIVARDASGNFSAGTITATLSGTATQVSNSLTAGTHLSGGPFNGSSAVTLTTDATDANTVSTIVARDASGNFSAGQGTFTTVATPAVSYSGGALTITGGGVTPSALTLDDTQTTLALDGGAGYGDSTLTTAFNALTWAHTAGVLDIGSVNGTWQLGLDGKTYFPNYNLPYVSGAVNTVLTNDGSGNVTWALPGGGGSTFGNVTVGVDTDQTISTTSGDLILQTAAGVNAGTITLAAGVNGDITLAPNGTGNVILSDDSYVLGQLVATRNTAYVPPGSPLTTLAGSNGIVIASSSGGAGYGASIAVRYHSGDTTAGVTNAAAVNFSGASGTNSAPGGAAANQVLGSNGFDGYTAGTSNNYASQIATANQGAGTTGIAPLQAQGYARQAFTNSVVLTTTVTGASGTGSVATLTFTTQNTAPYAVGQTVAIAGMTPAGYDNAAAVITAATTSSISYANTTTGFTSGGTIAAVNTVTAAGMGYRIRGFANSTNMTAANRFNFMDLTASTANFKSAAYTFANDVITGSTLTATNYMTLGSTGVVMAAPTTGTYASISPTSSTFTNSSINNFIRTGTVNTTVPAILVRYTRTDTVNSNDGDGVDFRLSTAGSVTTNNIARFDAQFKATGLHQVGISVSNDSFAADTDTIYRGQADKTIIRATPTGTTGTAADVLTVEQAKITAAAPIQFPTYTIAGAGAITGAAGWQISISNSTGNGGRMAYWDTTNARWNYVSDDTAI